ncbi:MAG: Rieske 2Fe-2S domain-containing protein [Burkholderiales bacterium]|nr:Rieske 2Fe-2S domain-containing protein [Burkholderiales bacterium]
MSEALDYLLKVRPEAMGHYFRFMAEAGRHLDPKTRALISVITKVHAQTEAGFRQYLRRALKDGVRPMEVIDALLMAFPALGLTRIVWAIDVLIQMDLPEFRAAALTGVSDWHRVGDTDAFDVGETARIELAGQPLFVHRSAEEFRVYDARCPHQGTPIPEQALKGTRLTCPKHAWKFDVQSGRCTQGGDRPLRRLESKVVAGELLVYC